MIFWFCWLLIHFTVYNHGLQSCLQSSVMSLWCVIMFFAVCCLGGQQPKSRLPMLLMRAGQKTMLSLTHCPMHFQIRRRDRWEAVGKLAASSLQYGRSQSQSQSPYGILYIQATQALSQSQTWPSSRTCCQSLFTSLGQSVNCVSDSVVVYI